MAQQPPTFQSGGMVGGRRHSQGGTIIEAEQGEFVMNRDAVEGIGIENLNRMNQGGGQSVTVNISGVVMTEEFTREQVLPAIKEALERGDDSLNHSHLTLGVGAGVTTSPMWMDKF